MFVFLVNKTYSRNYQQLISVNIQNFDANQAYSIFVKASTSNTTFSKTESVQIRTLPEPSALRVVQTKANALILHWTPYKDILKYIVICKDLINHTSHVVRNSTLLPSNGTEDEITVDGLAPKTRYLFTMELFFRKLPNQLYNWPTDDRFIFETLADRPSNPGKPIISRVTDAVFKVFWEAAKNHGSPITHYSLEVWENYTRTVTTVELSDEFVPMPESKWIERYKGTDNYWIIDATKVRVAHSTFRVRAHNEFGWGPYSEESTVFEQSFIPADRKDYLLLAIFIPVTVSVFVVMAGCMILGELNHWLLIKSETIKFLIRTVFNRRAMAKKIYHAESARALPIDVELANLRQFQRSENLIHNDNILYTQGQPVGDGELSMLAQIRIEQIRLVKPLGSGQFGDVFEGIVKNLQLSSDAGSGEQTTVTGGGGETETRVAIKKLKKGASEQDKNEFLQEAQLMSNCKHEHILHLIGVCFHADELYIVMELMQAGDLKMFLRQSRPTEVSN